MLNNITLIGRWSKDPDHIQTNNGTDILNATIAVSDPYNDEATFIEVKAFSKTALNAHQYTQKGSKVGIVGKLQQERWEKDGQKRSKHVVIAQNIIFLDEKKDNQSKGEQGMKAYEPPQDSEPADISDDDLPF